jgi:hypothetical protein
MIVFRVAVNDFGPVGGEHISIALKELTGLQRLELGGTCFRDFGWGGGGAVGAVGVLLSALVGGIQMECSGSFL